MLSDIEPGMACAFALILSCSVSLSNVQSHFSFENNRTKESRSFAAQSAEMIREIEFRMDQPRNKPQSSRDKYLLNLERADREGTPRLVLASTFDKADIVRSLISGGADPNATGPDGITALMVASRFGFAEIAELLLDARTQIDKQDARGAPALCFAAQNGHHGIAKLLLDRGANPLFNTIDGITFLYAAVAGGNADIVKLALRYPYQINARWKDGTTPLLLAAMKRRPDIAETLLDLGADVNIPNLDGTMPLIAAAPDDDFPAPVGTKLLSLLIKRGANVNAADNSGWTALMGASLYGDLEAVKLLVHAGANVSAADVHGRTAISLALEANHPDVLSFLRGLH